MSLRKFILAWCRYGWLRLSQRVQIGRSGTALLDRADRAFAAASDRQRLVDSSPEGEAAVQAAGVRAFAKVVSDELKRKQEE